jgi:hypothetical protein
MVKTFSPVLAAFDSSNSLEAIWRISGGIRGRNAAAVASETPS